MRQIYKGATDKSVVIRIIDSTTGLPETAVEHNTAGIDLQYRREGAVSTAITEVALAALTTAHTDGGIEHIGNGYYRLDVPDAAFATGADGVLIHGTVTGMVVQGVYVELIDPPAPLKNIALSDIPFYMVDATDGVTPETGLTVTAEVSKDAAAFGAAAGTVTEISDGVYQFDATAADMNADVLVFKFTATGARAALITISTIA